ncbi:hypothetical protein K0J45_07400 [Shewanella alkalitolerans]|uniref:DUF6942 family protein n=1 Tax=Shewanella alkalitolerans TaxID=2864209 RepID=UPI001C660EAB|nr:hypothetical protein [Shewanella alkalitolerans]QYJ99019.1 hypothetical protein K0J45_07400 [Shewanella alkalitolerans]
MSKNVKPLGLDGAKRCFYLPTPPLLPADWQDAQPADLNKADSEITSLNIGSLESLIALNGNNWRKILVIMAKLSAPDDDWRGYMDKLLQRDEQIRFGADTLSPQAKEHYVCGQQSAIALGLTPLNEPKTFTHQQENGNQIYLLPYLDYRQCPNALIADLRELRDSLVG